MEFLKEKFSKIYIHEDSWQSPVARRARSLFDQGRIEKVRSAPLEEKNGKLSAADFSRSKRLLYIAPYAGQFFKRCPGSRPGLMCCNYFVLNLGLQCDMNCSYCYLQSYINTPVLTIYSNIDQALDELRLIHEDLGSQKVRVGTGEVIDSLSLDPLTLYSRRLIEVFRDFPEWTIEFKTKSSFVDQFLDLEHGGNVIVSWSVNPEYIVKREELGTADLNTRLQAARACLDRNFQVALHLDPIVWHPEWKENYGRLADKIVEDFRPEEIRYISLGTLRFQPDQRHMMRERFGWESLINQAEVFQSQDGKMRYATELRAEMFDFILGRFKADSAHWRILLCMETPETWITTMGQPAQRQAAIQDLFDSSVLRSHNRWALN